MRRGLLLVCGLGACDPAPARTATPTDAVAPSETSSLPQADRFVSGRGEGPTEDLAYAAARDDLARALFEDPAWVELTGIEIHRRGQDPQVVQVLGSGIAITVGLDRTRAATVLSAFENAEPTPDGPAPWRDTLVTHARAHLAAHACRRRRALFDNECETGDTSDVDAALAELVGSVVLASGYGDGVPVDAEGVTRRPIPVYGLWKGLPIADIPIRVGDEVRRTDANGRVFVDPPADGPFRPTAVRLDTEALLGPNAAAWKAPRVELAPRPRSARRWGLVVVGPDGTDPVPGALTQALGPTGFPAPAEIPARHRAPIAQASTEGSLDALPKIADALSGAVDVVVRVAYDCGFAGRMGGNRVWFEAVATLTVYDAWTGRVLGHEEVRAKANGVGDDRADAAARKQLAQRLAERIARIDEIGPG